MTMNKGIYEKGSVLRTFTVATGQTPTIGDLVYVSAEGEISQAGDGQNGMVGVLVDIRFRGEYTQFPDGAYKNPYTAAAGDEVTVCVGGIVTCLTSGTPAIGNVVSCAASGAATNLTLRYDTIQNLSIDVLKAKGRFIKVDNSNNVAQIYLEQ